MPTYRLHDTTGDDLAFLEHYAPNVAPGDIELADGREALHANHRGRGQMSRTGDSQPGEESASRLT